MLLANAAEHRHIFRGLARFDRRLDFFWNYSSPAQSKSALDNKRQPYDRSEKEQSVDKIFHEGLVVIKSKSDLAEFRADLAFHIARPGIIGRVIANGALTKQGQRQIHRVLEQCHLAHGTVSMKVKLDGHLAEPVARPQPIFEQRVPPILDRLDHFRVISSESCGRDVQRRPKAVTAHSAFLFHLLAGPGVVAWQSR